MIGKPIRICHGQYAGQPGTYWAWPVDGYYDLHHARPGVQPDGSDVVSECHATLAEARQEARERVDLDRWAAL